MRVNSTILHPVVTEKSVKDAESNKYHFKVSTNASKTAIANEVARLFDVDVVSVKTLIMPGKKKRVLRTFKYTKTSKWKKAIVEIKEGQKINLVEDAQ